MLLYKLNVRINEQYIHFFQAKNVRAKTVQKLYKNRVFVISFCNKFLQTMSTHLRFKKDYGLIVV